MDEFTLSDVTLSDVTLSDVIIRAATDDDLSAIGRLRWDSTREKGWEPGSAAAEKAAKDTDEVTLRDQFAERFQAWARDHHETHSCTVAAIGRSLVGTAWLALSPRVPSPRAFDRAHGDIQSVFVIPGLRNRGIGNALIAAVLEHADAAGLERVTVQSTAGAVTAYERSGFSVSPLLLQVLVHPLHPAPSTTRPDGAG